MHEIIQFITQHPILSLSWITLFSIIIILTFNRLYAKIENITHVQAVQLINKEKAITIDLRPYNDFYKGHIINSINLDPLKIKDNNIKDLEKYKQKLVIIVTANGVEAIKPAKQLVQYGFQNIFILKNGITGWSNENLPLISGKK